MKRIRFIRLKPITKWYEIAEDGREIFNHFEDGHNATGTYPPPFRPEYSNQVKWSKKNWVKKFALLEPNSNRIINL